jgi:hypothetical protein
MISALRRWLTPERVVPLALVALGTGLGILLSRPALPAGEDPPPPPDPARYWRPLEGKLLALRSGAIYRGTVKLPWYVPSSAVADDKVREYAEARNWGAVRVWRSRPDGWPGDAKADRWVEARWQGGYETQEKPDELTSAFELV